MESPIKHKMLSAGENFLSQGNISSSEQKDRETRARVAIKKLLESEAERNEDLSEDNQVIEKQIKSLILLLVEKDLKIRELKIKRPEKKLAQKLALQRFVVWIRKMMKFKAKAGFLSLKGNFLSTEKDGILVRARGKRLKRLFRWTRKYLSVYMRVIKRKFDLIERVIMSKFRIYFSLIVCSVSELRRDHFRYSARLAKLLIAKNYSSRLLYFWFSVFKSKTVCKNSSKSKDMKKILCHCLRRVINTKIRALFNSLHLYGSKFVIQALKDDHKSFLSTYKSKIQLEIYIKILDEICKQNNFSTASKSFNKWKSRLPKSISKLNRFKTLMAILIHRRFHSIIQISSKTYLPNKLLFVFSQSLQSTFKFFQLLYRKNRILAYKKQIAEAYTLCLSAKEKQELLESQIEKSDIESKFLHHKKSELESRLTALHNELSSTDSEIIRLKQEIDSNSKKISSLSSPALNSSKFTQESQTLQLKISQQQDYLNLASSKLNQLIEKHEKLTQENLSIQNHCNLTQQNIEATQQKYSKIIEEMRAKSEQKNDVQSLAQTYTLLEEELRNLLVVLKSESQESRSAKDELTLKVKHMEQMKSQIEENEEIYQETEFEINRLENELNRESETKEIQLQEIVAEISHVKEKLSKSKEEIEKLNNVIKENSGKAKSIVKLTEDLHGLQKVYENNRKKLGGLKESSINNVLSISDLQKQIKDIDALVRAHKEENEKKRVEISFLENKIALAELTVQESQKQLQVKLKTRGELENYVKTLEQQVNRLEEACFKQNSQDLNFYNNENTALAQKAERLERELEYFNEEAAQRRREVAQVKPEIENYRIILAAMEEKIAENELKIRETEMEKERFRAETKILRDRLNSLNYN